MDRLDPARTALVLVHMVKGVVGDVDTPFNRLFRQRAEKAGLIGIQQRLLDRFRAAGAMVVYTLVAYQPGLPRVTPAVGQLRRAGSTSTTNPLSNVAGAAVSVACGPRVRCCSRRSRRPGSVPRSGLLLPR